MDGRTTITSITERTATWARETATGTEAVAADEIAAEGVPDAKSEGHAERLVETGTPAKNGGTEISGVPTAIAPSMRADGTVPGPTAPIEATTSVAARGVQGVSADRGAAEADEAAVPEDPHG